MKYSKPAVTLTLLLTTTFCQANENGVYLRVQTLFFSEPVAIKALNNDWNAPLESGNAILSYDKAEFGVSWKNWELGIQRRYDYFYHFTTNTADLFHADKNQTPLTSGQSYKLSLSSHSFQAKGLRIAHKKMLSSTLSMNVALTYLQGIDFTDGTVAGQATAIADKDYDYTLDVDYAYSEDTLFDRQNAEPSGEGYTLDLGLAWNPNADWHFDLDAFDLISAIHWDNAPFTLAEGTTDTKTFDENNYVIYNPVVSGLEDNRDFKQRPLRKVFFDGRYRYDLNFSLIAQYDYFEIQDFFSAGARYTVGYHSHIEVLYNPIYDASTVRFISPYFRFELSSDSADLEQARLFALSFSFFAPL